MAAHGVGATYTLQHQEQLQNIIEGYDVCIGAEEPIPFDHKTPKNKPAKRKTYNSMGEAYQTTRNHEVVRHIPGMFPKGSNLGIFEIWIAAHNTIMGGEGYQHAHSDQGRYNEFIHLDVFPFVAIHAFGEESFKLWVLPQPDKRTFGFLHTLLLKTWCSCVEILCTRVVSVNFREDTWNFSPFKGRMASSTKLVEPETHGGTTHLFIPATYFPVRFPVCIDS
jgi:hypothetical protein